MDIRELFVQHCEDDEYDVALELMSQNPDVDFLNYTSKHAKYSILLYFSIATVGLGDSLELFKRFIEHPSIVPEKLNWHGVLANACVYKGAKFVEYMLTIPGVNPNDYISAIIPLVKETYRLIEGLDIMRVLLKDPRMDVNQIDRMGMTALEYCVKFNNLEFAKLLLSHEQMNIYRTPLSLIEEVCRKGKREMLCLLMEFQNLDITHCEPLFGVEKMMGFVKEGKMNHVECLIATGELLIPRECKGFNSKRTKDPAKRRLVEVVERFKKEPRASICEMRFKLKIPQRWVGQVFVLLTTYDKCKPDCTEDTRSAVKILRLLPSEIKMLIVNLACGITDKPFISQEAIARGARLLQGRESLKASKSR